MYIGCVHYVHEVHENDVFYKSVIVEFKFALKWVIKSFTECHELHQISLTLSLAILSH